MYSGAIKVTDAYKLLWIRYRFTLKQQHHVLKLSFYLRDLTSYTKRLTWHLSLDFLSCCDLFRVFIMLFHWGPLKTIFFHGSYPSSTFLVLPFIFISPFTRLTRAFEARSWEHIIMPLWFTDLLLEQMAPPSLSEPLFKTNSADDD